MWGLGFRVTASLRGSALQRFLQVFNISLGFGISQYGFLRFHAIFRLQQPSAISDAKQADTSLYQFASSASVAHSSSISQAFSAP